LNRWQELEKERKDVKERVKSVGKRKKWRAKISC